MYVCMHACMHAYMYARMYVASQQAGRRTSMEAFVRARAYVRRCNMSVAYGGRYVGRKVT